MNTPRLIALGLFLAGAARLFAVAEPFVPAAPMIQLWPGIAPGSEGRTAPERWVEGAQPDPFHRVTDIHVPTLTVYQPSAAERNGTAVIIAPGGGHRYLVVELEGEFVAQRLTRMGITAFVLRSRLARAEGSTYRAEVESKADLQQAIRLVRARAAEWNLNPAHVGVMGFSAGGHLVALSLDNDDPALRPDFAVLSYPGWGGEMIRVAPDAPPVFMWVNHDDPLAQLAGEYYLHLRRAGVGVEFHVFRRGGHGVGLSGRTAGFGQLGASAWPDLFQFWLRDFGMLP
jgi:acetyl esterase/lipase